MIDAKIQYAFKTVPDDLLKVQRYTLSNGLQLFLSVNKNEPRVFTNIVVKAGSKQDPPETTGLAHYMEHMLFKGTSRIGTLDWEKESILLEQISDLYEAHRATQDEDERRRLYAEIDRISFEAAKLTAPSEYDKMVSNIGAKSTNAYTWVEQTVYVNDIPSNELERWMSLESERFRMMALRLFHTELETVYEEFNINQDKDIRKVNTAIREVLFPSHPYGTQTTIGKAEHLRTPSQVNIQQYFKTYYVPNNMAIMMAGDFDPQEVVELAERHFGHFEAKPLPSFTFEAQPDLKEPVRRIVYGQEPALVMLAWRFDQAKSEDTLYLGLIRALLYNDQAGLLDLNLNQQQKILESEAWFWFYEDYSVFGLYGKPRQDQTLEEVSELLLGELKRICSGEFDEWMVEAVTTDFKLGQVMASESNEARVSAMTSSFVLGMDWEHYTRRQTDIAKITKAQIVDFAQKHFGENYVEVHKVQAEDSNVVKVVKPLITAVELNRDAISDYAQTFLESISPRLEPVFVDFETAISSATLSSGIHLDYVGNPNNSLFRLDYIFPMGKNSDRKLAMAVQYFPYLGTDRYSSADLQRELFRLGLSFEVTNDDDYTYMSLSGLEDNVVKGLELLEHILSKLQPDAKILENVVEDTLTHRANAKKDRNLVLRNALGNYARYGNDSPFTYRLSMEELKQLEAEELCSQIKALSGFEHKIYYYGQTPMQEVIRLLETHHYVSTPLKPAIVSRNYQQLDTKTNQVIFLDFPIVQTDVMLVSKGTPNFNMDEHLMSDLFNDYFGVGLSSIVFQEIRESKALAYSTYAFYSSPRKRDWAHYLQAYVGTQPDKLSDAIPTFLQLLNEMPIVESQIEHARQAILKRVESERIIPSRIYWTARANREQGYNTDMRREIYQHTEQAKIQDLVAFHEEYVRGRAYTFLVMGSKSQVNLKYLETFGELKEVSLEEVFGY
ncbi:insulinase family protein [Haliscomenobacter sp.]|uniref:M16 family metallopeptidase n=1 Tax=Haliscomenobacter sp. TaxID=2717303 RepID=UPI003364DFAB